MNILFVCTGNSCRSPMAEGIMKKILAGMGIDDSRYHISSAGLYPESGSASSEAVKAVAKFGIDIGEHKPTRLDVALVEKADLILTMTRSHKDMILRMYPQGESKSHVLKEYSRSLHMGSLQTSVPIEYDFSLDVSDPFGMGMAVYEKCAGELFKELEIIAKHLFIDNQGLNLH